jgi:hypothetical protein
MSDTCAGASAQFFVKIRQQWKNHSFIVYVIVEYFPRMCQSKYTTKPIILVL